MKDRRYDQIAERLQAVERTMAVQAGIDSQVQHHIKELNEAMQQILADRFRLCQQIEIYKTKVDEALELTGVLESEANEIKVDQNAYRDAMSGLSQQVDALYGAIQRMGHRLQAAADFTSLFGDEK